MLTLIPASGLSTRFAARGHVGHKSRLVISYRGVERTMIEHVLAGLPDARHVLVGSRLTDCEFFASLSVAVCPVTETVGQAHTVLQMVRHARLIGVPDDGALVLNCDALLHPLMLQIACRIVRDNEVACAFTACCTTDTSWSFYDVLTDRTYEKPSEVDGGWVGMSGAWAFRSLSGLEQALTNALRDGDLPGEPYLSHAINYLPGVKTPVRHRLDQIVDWGTPERVIASGARIIGEK